MVSINIKEFEGYDVVEFNDFLIAQKEERYEIIIPKETTMFFTSNNEIAWEFAIAAFVGQKLYNISSEFEYEGASLGTPGEFSFTITTNNTAELADLLSLVSGGFGNSEIMESLDLSSEVSYFIDNVDKMDVICKDLLDTFHEYYSSDEEQNG